MTYQLKGGDYVKGGKLYGWTGQQCAACDGHGQNEEGRACNGCGGTGEEHGLMHAQPADLPSDTE